MPTTDVYAAIMAGGTGTRLWPRSRENHPKQLHAFLSHRTLIQETIADIAPLISGDRTVMVTGQTYEAAIRRQVPSVRHYIIEPFKLGKLLAIGAAAAYLAQLNPQAIMVLLWADSYIGKKNAFLTTLSQAITAARAGTNSIIGVRPSYPATQYGYIELGGQLEPGLHRLKSFQEKPDLQTAERFVHSSRYVWNPGISVWRVDLLLKLYQELEPAAARALQKLAEVVREPTFTAQAARLLKPVPKLEIEDTIYQNAHQLAVLPADIGWDDVGNWSAIKDLLGKEGNVVAGNHIGIDTDNCLIQGQDKLIATIGLQDLLIIDTPDAILIADKHQSQKVKDIVAELKKQHLHQYL